MTRTGVSVEDTELYFSQEDRSQTKANLNPNSVFGDQPDETLLVGLESQEEFIYSGEASGVHLSTLSGYSDAPLQALAEYTAELEAYVNGNQGTGWAFNDRERGKQYNGVIESVAWRRKGGEPFSLSWDMSVMWAQATMAAGPHSPESVSPGGTPTLAGQDLGAVDETQVQRSQDIEQYPVALADPGQNLALANSGVIREVTIVGRITDETRIDTFDNTIQQNMGNDTIVTYEEPFPGRTMEGMIQDFTGTREAGKTRIGQYQITFVEGQR